MRYAQKIKKCRVCKSTNLTPVIDLGKQYLQGLFTKSGSPLPPSIKIPMTLIFCGNCSLLQTKYTVSRSVLYIQYWYRSGINKTMRDHLKKISEETLLMVKNDKVRVLDIGCNDGTLLNFYPKDFIKTGIDPSNAVGDINDGLNIIKDFFPSRNTLNKLNKDKFDIITSIAVFYDIDDPVTFVKKIKQILALSGIWIFEVYYMPALLKKGCYDMICHEHLAYFSLKVLRLILKKSGMKLIKVQKNSINGASILCFATHEENNSYSKYESYLEIKKIEEQEKKLKLESKSTYLNYQKKIELHRDKLLSLIRKIKGEGKRIHLYGASTKGNTVLQFCGLDNSIIEAAADRNPEKHGAKTLGTNIPIISEEASRRMKPNYYLVLPWAFKDEFIKRERKILEGGTIMIFPFPKIEIVKN